MNEAMHRLNRFVWVVLFLLFTARGYSADNLTLWVDVDGAMSNKGQAICGVFTSKESFLKRAARSQTAAINDRGTASFEFTGLQSGTYAVSVIYDEDGNGELNKNLLGIPTEPFGTSNNVKNRFGPPKFKKAAFHLNSDKRITIHLGKIKE